MERLVIELKSVHNVNMRLVNFSFYITLSAEATTTEISEKCSDSESVKSRIKARPVQKLLFRSVRGYDGLSIGTNSDVSPSFDVSDNQRPNITI